MTEITGAQTPPTGAGGAGATRGAAPGTGASEPDSASLISSDFDTFLQMLTAQVQNQDPLNPLDSTDFATQLATFSGVEQQVQSNDLLRGLGESLSAGGLADLAGWVGMQARAPVPVRFDGGAIDLQVAPQADAARTEMRIYDEAGTLRDRFTIPAEGGPVSWSGVAEDGTRFADGTYRFVVTGYDAEGAVISETTPEVYAEVAEVRRGASGNEVVFASGAVVPSAEVSALRRP
jgi:flagellar basal-body rod modification protein FlgD